MKVMMLGWEFPPHISGGLGTACFGLTQGLSVHGVEVLFVVPRAHGDEDQRYVRVTGANQVSLVDVIPGARRSVEHAWTSMESEEIERTAAVLERVDRAAAQPDGGAAIERVDRAAAQPDGGAAIERADRAAAAPGDGEALERFGRMLEILAIDSPLVPYLDEKRYVERLKLLRERRARAPATEAESKFRLEHLKSWLVRHRAHSGHVDEIAASLTQRGTLEFSGLYGPNLMAEVSRYAVAVAELARTREFDVIHAHDWMTAPAGIAAARISGKPLVLHVHASEYDRSGENVNWAVREIEQLGLDGADIVVCVSHYTANLLQQKYRIDPKKLRVVHNAVTQREQVEQLHVEKTIDEPIVLFLGRVTFQKGPDYFLEAASRVIKIEPNVKFVMSGSGDMLPVMIERAARLGLARHMHFTGFLKGSDVERMYAMADIYVMPSVSEPFGITPLEAMALDTPVVLSRQSGVSEVLRNALKVDFWDVQDIANKVLALLKYPALRDQLTEDGREEIRRIRWEYPAALVRDVYRELVA
jgi:glycosyltransferase involved in cell wall biosynthesis